MMGRAALVDTSDRIHTDTEHSQTKVRLPQAWSTPESGDTTLRTLAPVASGVSYQ